MTINEQLKIVYKQYLSKLIIASQHEPNSFSYPLLMKVFPDYKFVKKKILFVGKETYGWISTLKHTSNLTVELLMDSYEEFEFAKYYHGRNSPFWRFIRKIHQTINGTEFPNGILWTNFSKCDCNRTTPNYKLQRINDIGFNLIKDEIRITKPDIVLFITGWNYEHEFQRVFSGIQYETIEENYIYKCSHNQLTDKTFMTMHPNGLNYRSKLNSTIEKILDQL